MRPRAPKGIKLNELYWNVTGSEWQIPIESTSVTVTGPAAPSAITCASGTPGSTTSCLSHTKTADGAKFS